MCESDMLDAWQEKYCPESIGTLKIKFCGYEELAIKDGFRMGYCTCTWSYIAGCLSSVEAKIYLDNGHLKCPMFFRDAVLWHEFCHAWDCYTEQHVDHCASFQRKKWKKPLYALGDIALKLIGWIWFD